VNADELTHPTPLNPPSFALALLHGSGSLTDTVSIESSGLRGFGALETVTNFVSVGSSRYLKLQWFSRHTPLSPIPSSGTIPGKREGTVASTSHSSFPAPGASLKAVATAMYGNGEGIYTLGMSSLVAPAPEPSAWTMLAAALMVMAFIAWRRSSAMA
jgi:hypothetical protein